MPWKIIAAVVGAPSALLFGFEADVAQWVIGVMLAVGFGAALLD